jgi:hypothetical protein
MTDRNEAMARIPIGTTVETFNGDIPERAVIVEPRTENLPLPSDEWYVIRFDEDGGKLCVHQSGFRIIDR